MGLKMDCLISVIVPVYNAEDYLDACIQSVLRQTYTDVELVLVDDGSTDNSGKLCDRYAAKYGKIHVIHNQNPFRISIVIPVKQYIPAFCPCK